MAQTQDLAVVILAAGIGSRLGQPFPKPLTKVSEHDSIMALQLRKLQSIVSTSQIHTVVGFKKEMIMEEFPTGHFLYNPDFDRTNTSVSLAIALELTGDRPTLWMNGDVVFEDSVINLVSEQIALGTSFCVVNQASVAEEEVKYRTDPEGYISEISKEVVDGEGEAVGINFVNAADKAMLIDQLRACGPNDYFERGIETAIQQHGLKFRPIDLGATMCLEIDFPEDLDRARGEVERIAAEG